MANWVRLDLSVIDNPPEYITPDDRCFYLRDYLVDKATKTSAWKLNQVVWNFKIKPTVMVANPSRERFKIEATETFAGELAEFITRPALFAPLPCSKTTGHADFDNRLMKTLERARAINPYIHICSPLTRTVDIESRHNVQGPRSPMVHLNSITCTAIPDAAWPMINGIRGTELYVLDDVLTSGSTFRACKQLLNATHPNITVGGIFWARRRTIVPCSDTTIEDIAKSVGLPKTPRQ